MKPSIGMMFQRDVPPELLRDRVRLVETLGLDDVWIVEDLFFAGGVASAATALQATEHVTVGIGILPSVVRNPVFAAMELAALMRLHPGRVLPGIGHGMQDWMQTVGARVESPVLALEETLTCIGRLLDGDVVTMAGRYVRVDHAKLAFPPERRPPLLAGVRGPKSVALAGRVADGLVLAEPTSADYIRWARNLFEKEAKQAGRKAPTVVAYTWLSIADDARVAQDRIRPLLASIPGGLSEPSVRPHIEALKFSADLIRALEQNTDQASLGRALRPEWIDQLAVVGTPADCARALTQLSEAGADHVVLVPIPDRIEEQVNLLATTVAPLLSEATAHQSMR